MKIMSAWNTVILVTDVH